MKRKKGFTLVELLATLVVLSIILGIAIPKIGDMVKESRKRAFFTDSKSIIRQIQYKNQEFSSENLANLDLGGINVEGINLNESNAYFDNDTIFLDLVGKDKYEGMYLCGVTASSINDKVRSVPCDDTIVALTVLLNDGKTTQKFESTYPSNSNLTLLDPTKEDYKFFGWEVVSGDATVNNKTITFGSKNTTIYAKWGKVILLSTDLNGGTIERNFSGEYQTYDNVELLVPTKTGYSFNKWNLESGNSIISGNKIMIGTKDTSIKALYGLNTYIIGYTLNNGTLSATNPTSYTFESNTITLNNPTRNGYTFAGWTGSNGSTKQTTVTIPKGSTGNKNYTANYDVVPYTISYTLNGGSATNPTSYNIETNTITLNNPTKNGYTFAGWTGSNGSTKQTTVTIPKGSTGNKDYTANYYQNNYQNTTTNAYFEKLSDAFNACANNQVIKVLNNTTEIVQPTAKAGITTKLDLNGKTITLNNVTLVNAGTLEIYSSVAGGIIQGNANDLIQNNASCTLTTNSSSTNAITIRNTKTSYGGSVLLNNGTATLNSNTTLTFNNDATGTESDRYVIINNKALTVNGATITSTAATAVKGGHGIAANAAGATTTISSGTVNTTGDSIHNKLGTMTITTVSAHSTKGFSLFSGTTGSTATPTMTINNGTFTSDVRSCLGLEAGTVTVNNGTLSSAGACVVWARNSTVNIKGGTYTENVNANIAAIAINEGATGNISGGTFNGPYNTTIAGAVASNSVLNVTGGTYKLTGKYPVLGINGGTLNITGGTFENTNAEGAVLTATGGTTNIKGGTIKSAYLPVYIANSATVNIGTNDGSVSTTNPTIISTKSGGVGIAVNSGTWNFYDGRIYAAYVGTQANSGVASGKSLKSASDNTYMSGGKRFYLG